MATNAPIDKTPTPTPDDEELTPAEEKKFTKFLGKWLEEDDSSSHTTAPVQGTANTGNIDIAGEINRALDARESKKKSDEERATKDKELAALKAAAAVPKKVRGWFSPLIGD